MKIEPSPSAAGALADHSRKSTSIPEGAWVGVEKVRYDFVLKYLSGHSTSRGYVVHNFVDKNGARFLAFHDNETLNVSNGNGTEGAYHELVTGDCFTCKATVNRHSINNYKYGDKEPFKETVLNRIKYKTFIGRIV